MKLIPANVHVYQHFCVGAVTSKTTFTDIKRLSGMAASNEIPDNVNN